MIPKKIHYIWLGGNPLPKIAEKCIKSWKKYCPDYEIIRWDESNLDLEKYQYCKDALKEKKYAFASDVLRFEILYNNGGIYLDIDVELIKPIDNFLEDVSFVGFENEKALNPGSIYGVEKGDKLCKEMLDYYKSANYYIDRKNNETVCTLFTRNLIKYGLKINGCTQDLSFIKVYSQDYFTPIDFITDKKNFTKNTCSIHWYNASWFTPKQKFKRLVRKILNFFTFGGFGQWLERRKNGKN